MALRWEKREDSDGLILVHYVGHCQNSGRKFYAPVHNLTEFKEDSGG